MKYCPQCGSFNCIHLKSESALDPFFRYFSTIRKIIFSPTIFFQSLPSAEGISHALTFAIIVHWLSSAILFIEQGILQTQVQSLLNPAIQPFLENHFGISFSQWLWGTGAVLLDPFFTAIAIVFSSFFVFVGTRILISAKISFESVLRIISYGMAPILLSIIPVIGPLIASISIFVVTVIAIKEIYQVRTGRAVLVVLFPKLLILSGLLFATLFFSLTFLGIFSLLFN